jgi:hypothetical protein
MQTATLDEETKSSGVSNVELGRIDADAGAGLIAHEWADEWRAT